MHVYIQSSCIHPYTWHHEECSRTPPPANGGITFSSSSLYVGTKITYSCNHGYTLYGSSVQFCQRRNFKGVIGASWSDEAPRCWKSGKLIIHVQVCMYSILLLIFYSLIWIYSVYQIVHASVCFGQIQHNYKK